MLPNIPGIRDTVNINHIKHGYYSITSLNPNRMVPTGPDLNARALQCAQGFQLWIFSQPVSADKLRT